MLSSTPEGRALRQARKVLNRRWRTYEYNIGAIELQSMPDIFAIESTNYCNLKCVMCPRGEPDLMERPLGNMPDDVFMKIVKGWQFYTEPVWLHLFGEPLMHPRLFEQIAMARTAGVPNIGISSNATLLNEKNAQKILDSDLDTIILSIDGCTKETYESVRKSPAFTYEEVRANVHRFFKMKLEQGKAKPYTIVQMIVMEETRQEQDGFKEEWQQSGASEVLFKQYTVWGDQSDEHSFAGLAPTEIRAHLEAVRPRPHPCHHMWSTCVVAWDGRVLPCCFDFDAVMTMGDLRTQSLEEIWNGEKYQALRAAELAGTNDSPLCRNCKEAPGYARNPNVRPPTADGADEAPLEQEQSTVYALGV
jgi:radical SAM protein with 4Fe4S-binding SPASM domain